MRINRFRSFRGQRGHTLVELMMACFVLAIVAGSLALFIRSFFYFISRDNLALKLSSQRAKIVAALDNDLRATKVFEPIGLSSFKLTFFGDQAVLYLLDNGELKRMVYGQDNSQNLTVLGDELMSFSLAPYGAQGYVYEFSFQKAPEQITQAVLLQPR